MNFFHLMLFALSLNSFESEAKSDLNIELVCREDVVGVICVIPLEKGDFNLLIVNGIKWETEENLIKLEGIIEISLKQFSSRIPSKIGIYFSNIKNLIIHNSNLNRIQRNDFTSMTQLEKLQLYENQIENIETNSFYDLTYLEYLDLDGNNLFMLPAELLLHSKYLRVFLAASNQISKISVYFFKNTKMIRKIDLSLNQLQDIDFITKSSHDFADLAYINLKYNSNVNFDKFYSIEEKFQDKLRSIEKSKPKLEDFIKFTANKVESIFKNLQQCETQNKSVESKLISLKQQDDEDYLS